MDKVKQTEDGIKGNQKKAKVLETGGEKETENKGKYNREKVMAIFEDLINTGRFDQSKVKNFEKFDQDLGKMVKYVRIEITKPTVNNDHFISLKPDNLQNKPFHEGEPRYKEQEGWKNYGYTHQEKKDKPAEQGHIPNLAPAANYPNLVQPTKNAEQKFQLLPQIDDPTLIDETSCQW